MPFACSASTGTPPRWDASMNGHGQWARSAEAVRAEPQHIKGMQLALTWSQKRGAAACRHGVAEGQPQLRKLASQWPPAQRTRAILTLRTHSSACNRCRALLPFGSHLRAVRRARDRSVLVPKESSSARKRRTLASCCTVCLATVTMAAADVEMAVSAPEQPSTSSQEEEDLYTKLKALQRTLEFLDIQVSKSRACQACVLSVAVVALVPYRWICRAVIPCTAVTAKTDRQHLSTPARPARARAGGLHQGGAAQSEEGAAAGGRGGQEDTVSAPFHRAVPGNGGRQLRRRQLHDRCGCAVRAASARGPLSPRLQRAVRLHPPLHACAFARVQRFPLPKRLCRCVHACRT